jgi:hypothetical protein
MLMAQTSRDDVPAAGNWPSGRVCRSRAAPVWDFRTGSALEGLVRTNACPIGARRVVMDVAERDRKYVA